MGLRGSAGIETRVHLPEFAAREINSPGEPGVLYHMGIGFASSRVPEAVAGVLACLRERAARRAITDPAVRATTLADPHADRGFGGEPQLRQEHDLQLDQRL